MATITVEKNALSDVTSAAVVNANEVVKPKRKSLRKSAKKDAAPAPEAKVEAPVDVPVEAAAPAPVDSEVDPTAAFFAKAAANLKLKVENVPAEKAKPKAKTEAKEGGAAKTDTVKVKSSNFVAKVAAKGQNVYGINPHKRPGSGRLLFAHTHAALTVLGMLEAARPAVGKSHVITMIGTTAVGYHVGQQNMELTRDGYRLTILGYNKFGARLSEGKFNADDATAFQEVMLDGNPSDRLNIGKDDVFVAFKA